MQAAVHMHLILRTVQFLTNDGQGSVHVSIENILFGKSGQTELL